MVSIAQPDIILGTESWLDAEVSDTEVFPSGYVSYRKDRNTRGGGVFILVRDTLQSMPLHCSDNASESVWCRILFSNGSSLVVGSFYRPPGSNSIEPLVGLSRSLTTVSAETSDFNLPEVTWRDHRPVENSHSGINDVLYQIVRTFDLFQFVDFPTRSGRSGGSVLDLIFSNRRDLLRSVIATPGISDHDVVVGSVVCQGIEISKPRHRKVFSYDKGNYDAINELSSFFSTVLRSKPRLRYRTVMDVVQRESSNVSKLLYPLKNG